MTIKSVFGLGVYFREQKEFVFGLVYIFGTSNDLLTDYTNLFWSVEGACGETEAELKI